MKHPPYHLRPNKAVDRIQLLRLIELVAREYEFDDYTYYGFGGPFLEDIRLLSRRFPSMNFVSIERDENTFNRQKFHRNTRNLILELADSATYIDQSFDPVAPVVVWFDYTDLRRGHFDQFAKILSDVEVGSIIRFTVRADVVRPSTKHLDPAQREQVRARWLEDFCEPFQDLLPANFSEVDLAVPNFPVLIQSMFQLVAQSAVPANSGETFQLASSTRYRDSVNMFSITGVKCALAETDSLIARLRKWGHSNVDWDAPQHIDVPDLSVKERLALERLLPVRSKTGRSLRRSLGYDLDHDEDKTLRQLKQYQEFFSYYPYFGKLDL